MFNAKESKLAYGKTPRWQYCCIDAYDEVEDPDNWMECPKCKVKPVVWRYDNGLSTACLCGDSKYSHFSIQAESIMSAYERGRATEHNGAEGLKNNWNQYCMGGEVVDANWLRTRGMW